MPASESAPQHEFLVFVRIALCFSGLSRTRLPAQVYWMRPREVSTWAAGIANGEHKTHRGNRKRNAAITEVRHLTCTDSSLIRSEWALNVGMHPASDESEHVGFVRLHDMHMELSSVSFSGPRGS